MNGLNAGMIMVMAGSFHVVVFFSPLPYFKTEKLKEGLEALEECVYMTFIYLHL